MWQEARKHEKKLKGMMVDYKRRAERRRDFYDKIRRDPAQFLQIHGRPLKVHIDANISHAAESCLVPWCGDQKNMIDRFDARAHLDEIDTSVSGGSADGNTEDSKTERDVNYERWKNLVQSEFMEVSESKVLTQIYNEERCGISRDLDNLSVVQQNANLKKKLVEKKAAIGYNYDGDQGGDFASNRETGKKGFDQDGSSSSSEDIESDVDYDTTIKVDTLSHEQGTKLNSIALKYGMKNDDFTRNLESDRAETERIRVVKEMENEKSMFSGRKSRRERKALKERRLMILRTNSSNPEDEKQCITKESESSSSESEPSPHNYAKVEFITCFGESSDEEKKAEAEEKKVSKEKDKIKSLRKKIQEEKVQEDLEAVVFGPSLPIIPTVSEGSVQKSCNKVISEQSRIPRSYRTGNKASYIPKRSRSRSGSIDCYGRSRKRSDRSLRKHRSSSRDGRSGSDRNKRSRQRTRSRSRERDSRDRRTRDRRSRDRRSRSRERSRERRASRSRSRRRRSRSRSRRRSNEMSRHSSRTSRRSSDRKQQNRRSRSRSNDKTRVSTHLSEATAKEVPVRASDIKVETYESSPPKNSIVVQGPPKSPPVKRYYRHDLREDESADESDEAERNDQSALVESAPTTSSSIHPKEPPAKAAQHHKLLRRTRVQIDKLYKLDKKVKEEKRIAEKKSRSHRSRSRSRSWSKSSSSN